MSPIPSWFEFIKILQSDSQDLRWTYPGFSVHWLCHITLPYTKLCFFGPNLPNIWEFVYFVWCLSPPKRCVIRRRNFARRRVPTMWRTCAGFYVYRGRRYENNDIFPKKCVQIGLEFFCGDLRSVGGTVGTRPIPAGWLAGCSSALGRYSALTWRVAIWLAPACLLM